MTSLASRDFATVRMAKPVALHRRGAAICWPLSLTMVVAAHLAAAWWLLSTHSPPPPIPQPLPAILLDMAPAPMPATAAPPKPPAPPLPDYHATPHPPTPQVQAPSIEEPKPLPAVAADVALPQQAKSTPKPVAKPKPVKPKKMEKLQPPTPAPPQTQPAPAAAPPTPSVDSQAQQRAAQQQKEAALAAATLAAKSNWLGEVVQHIAKFKRSPRSRLRLPLRTVLSFAIDRDGKLLSQHVLQSSGRDEIDDEALAWIKRADPLPKPPAEISDNDLAHGFTIPVDFMPR
ncbi:MAG TPA: TonB family protein [Terriglobales bacterium]|nr:TonB family protein [Terriglobales bacterium]